MAPPRLKYETRCADCMQRMFPGEEFLYAPGADGNDLRSHVECPPPRRGQNIGGDNSGLFNVRTCSSCRQVTAFHRPMLTPTCPYCGGDWERDTEVLPPAPATTQPLEFIGGQWWITNRCQDCDEPVALPCGDEKPSAMAVKFARLGFRACDRCHGRQS